MEFRPAKVSFAGRPGSRARRNDCRLDPLGEFSTLHPQLRGVVPARIRADLAAGCRGPARGHRFAGTVIAPLIEDMPWFKKSPDPISDRARALNNEIARLESQIKKLDGKLQRDQPQARLRSTAFPERGLPAPPGPPASSPLAGNAHEPVFEEVDQDRLQARTDSSSTAEHYNELGVRKYDLPALLTRLRNHFRGPSTTN